MDANDTRVLLLFHNDMFMDVLFIKQMFWSTDRLKLQYLGTFSNQLASTILRSIYLNLHTRFIH